MQPRKRTEEITRDIKNYAGEQGRRGDIKIRIGAIFFALFLLLAGEGRSQWTDQSPHKEKFAQLKGVKLQYLDWGGKGECLLWLSGMGNTPHLFDQIAPQFTKQYRCIGLARRGHGKSDATATGYSLDTLVADIRKFLDYLHVEKVVLVGHSFAGLEMTRFSTLNPRRVKSLIYLDAALDYSGMSGREDPVNIASTSEDLASFNASKKWFIRVFGCWSDGIEAEAREINLRPDGRMSLNTLPKEAVKEMTQSMATFTPRYSTISAPILAFYAITPQHFFIHLAPDSLRAKVDAYWNETFLLEKKSSMSQLQREKPKARIVVMNTQHLCFVRKEDESLIVAEMKKFLSGK